MLKENRKFNLGRRLVVSRLIPGLTIGALIFFGICAINPPRESAVNAADDTAKLPPSVTLTIASNASEEIEPTTDGVFKNIATVVRVQVANSKYYNISIRGDSNMLNTENPDAKINAISGGQKAAEFAPNTWGLRR